MDRRALVAAGALALAGGALLYLGRTGRRPGLSLTQQSVTQSYTPFAFWAHSSPMRYFHQYPAVIGAGCLPQPYATEDSGLALREVEVAPSAGYAQ